jgi:hypothetical protein
LAGGIAILPFGGLMQLGSGLSRPKLDNTWAGPFVLSTIVLIIVGMVIGNR